MDEDVLLLLGREEAELGSEHGRFLLLLPHRPAPSLPDDFVQSQGSFCLRAAKQPRAPAAAQPALEKPPHKAEKQQDGFWLSVGHDFGDAPGWKDFAAWKGTAE